MFITLDVINFNQNRSLAVKLISPAVRAIKLFEKKFEPCKYSKLMRSGFSPASGLKSSRFDR